MVVVMSLGLSKLTPEQRMAIGAELKKKPKKELEDFLLNLSDEERDELMYDTYVWLRPKQYVPIDHEKNVVLALCGRGSFY